jgi:hypothetical protein
VADFHHQPTARLQVCRSLVEYASYQIQSVAAAFQRHHRLMAEFRRQCAHGADPDVGWIGQDEVIAPALQRVKQIGAQQMDAVVEIVFTNIAFGHRERCG